MDILFDWFIFYEILQSSSYLFLSISLPPFRVTRRQMEPEALHNQSRITEIIIVRVAIITCK